MIQLCDCAAMHDRSIHEQASLPALLRHARATYGSAMRSALLLAGYDNIPESGLYLIARLASEGGGVSIGRLVGELGITKQGAGQLVDALVTRGYLARTPSELDRRQLVVRLTDRGRAAVEIQTRARMSIDAELAGRVTEADLTCTRRTLTALIEIGLRSPAATSVETKPDE
jgi:DNA-binding MarR family transcriptional regulator